jgi:hypothetical protein
MNKDEFEQALSSAISRIPDVVRADFASRDVAVRESAEETLIVRIMAAVSEHAKSD